MLKHGLMFKTDKVTHHGYDRFYDYFLLPFKQRKINFFEIGIDAGRSLKTWTSYFNNANIYGMDINKGYKHDRGEVFKGDQSKKSDLKKIIEEVGTADFIIDDGSHKPEHQLMTFNYLFKEFLNFGGIYIIEDIETSYWKHSTLYNYRINSGYNMDNNIVKIFSNIVEIVNREFLIEEDIKMLTKKSKIDIENLKYISFIMFGQNCVIIKKMSIEEYNKYGNRKYRFFENITK